MRTSTILITILLTIPLAGCLRSGPDADQGSAQAGQAQTIGPFSSFSGTGVADAITIDSAVGGPSWRVGDRYDVDIWTPIGPEEGVPYGAVVVEETHDRWRLAATDPIGARDEAVYDLPVLGDVFRGDLATTTYGADLALYRFPLHDGKEWNSTITVRDLTRWTTRAYDVSYTVVFTATIATPYGDEPGFVIEATLDNGTRVLEYDFVPALGWWSRLLVHDPETKDPDDLLLMAVTTGRSRGWTGMYHETEARPLITHMQWFIPFAPEESRFDGPLATFEVSSAAEKVFALGFSVAWQGIHETLLVAPDGERYEWRAIHAGPPSDVGATAGEIEVAAQAGTWTVTTVGAAVLFVGGVLAWSLVEHIATL